MISLESRGSFENTEKFLKRMAKGDIFRALHKYGEVGVDALARATPVESGLTASSWTYEIEKRRGSYSLVWKNTNTKTGVNVAILLQYGHGTGTGGWVQGYDYINPAIRPIFDRIANDVWKEVTRA